MSIAPEPPVVRLGPGLAGIRMTPEEFDAVVEYDEDYRYELIEGILIVTPVPLPQESDPNEELGAWLRIYRDQHPMGHTLNATLSEQYIRTPHSRRRADRRSARRHDARLVGVRRPAGRGRASPPRGDRDASVSRAAVRTRLDRRVERRIRPRAPSRRAMI